MSNIYIGDTPEQLGTIEAAGAIMIDGKIVTREDVRKLQQERNELAATVEALRDGIEKAREELSCCNVNSAGERLSHILEITQQQHLRDVRAEAVSKFIEFMHGSSDCQLCSKSLDVASKYAESVKVGE